jgi:O-antigen ligase
MSSLLPVWLLGILVAPNLTSETNSAVQIAAIIWFTAAGLVLGGSKFLWPPVFRQSPIIPICLGIFLLVILPGSAFYSVAPGASIGFWLTTIFAIITCGGLWGILDNSDVAAGLRKYAFISVPLLALLILPGYSVDIELLVTGESTQRLGGFRNPNSIGMIMLGLLLCLLLMRSKAVKIPLLVLGLVILFLTLSRSAISATVIAAGIWTLFNWKNVSKRAKVGLVSFGIVSLLFISVQYGRAVIEIVDSIAGFSDSQRGWGGGFTGRTEAWVETIELWADNPILGVGYRAHEPHLNSLSSAHNGYLALLAETGIFGTIPMMLFLVASSLRVLIIAREGFQEAQIGFALLCGMAFISLFERSLINFGNPSSILQLIFLLMPRPSRSLDA